MTVAHTPLLKRVTVYCGSAASVDARFKDAAFDMGQELARHKLNLIYGGGDVGLMKSLSDGCLAAHGHVTGVITDYLGDLEKKRQDVQNLRVVSTMAERKKIMYDKADGFVVLPGGYGTLEEFFEMLSWKQIALHTKPIVIVNLFHYWDPLKALLNHIVDSRFAPSQQPHLYSIVHHVKDVIPALHLPQSPENPAKKWDK